MEQIPTSKAKTSSAFKEFSAFYGTLMFVTVFKIALQLFLPLLYMPYKLFIEKGIYYFLLSKCRSLN
jgi:hypothetical protein